MKHSCAYDTTRLGYHDIIKKPMDFRTIEVWHLAKTHSIFAHVKERSRPQHSCIAYKCARNNLSHIWPDQQQSWAHSRMQPRLPRNKHSWKHAYRAKWRIAGPLVLRSLPKMWHLCSTTACSTTLRNRNCASTGDAVGTNDLDWVICISRVDWPTCD